jgi:coatomer subunit beta
LIILNKILALKKNYSKLLEDYLGDIINIINQDNIQSLEIN